MWVSQSDRSFHSAQLSAERFPSKTAQLEIAVTVTPRFVKIAKESGMRTILRPEIKLESFAHFSTR
jgi:hypothetical protein